MNIVLGALLAAVAVVIGSTTESALRAAPLYIAPTGSDSAHCSKTHPCLTMAHALKVAKPGQRVLLFPGNYDAQAIGEVGSGVGAPVSFAPVAGPPTLQSLTIEHASDFKLNRLVVKGQIVIENEHPERPGSTNITLNGVSAKTIRLIGRISKITVRGGSYGNAINLQPQIIKYNPEDPDIAEPTDILIDGVSFHDFRRTDDSVHTECLQILNG